MTKLQLVNIIQILNRTNELPKNIRNTKCIVEKLRSDEKYFIPPVGV